MAARRARDADPAVFGVKAMEQLEWHILKCIDFKLGVGAKDGHTAYDLLERKACCGKRHPTGREGREGEGSDDSSSNNSARKGRTGKGSLRSLNCLADTLASGGKDAPSGVSNSNNGAAAGDEDEEGAAAAELLWRRRIFVHHCAVAVLPMGAPGCSPAAVVRVADHRRALVSGGDVEEEALEAAARSCAAAVDAAVSWFYASSFVSLGRLSEEVDWWTSVEGDAEGDGEGGGEESAGWREKCFGRKRQRRTVAGDRP
jgi:hypothetical protein